MLFLVGAQPFATTLFGVPVLIPTPQERRAQQLKTRPECWMRGLHEASTQGIEATSANLFRTECLGMQRSLKAMLLRTTNVDLPECDCHHPIMVSAGRRSRLECNCTLNVTSFLPFSGAPTKTDSGLCTRRCTAGMEGLSYARRARILL